MAAMTKTKKSKKSPSKLDSAEKKAKTGCSSRVDRQLVEKAVAALVKHHNEKVMKQKEGSSKLQLLGSDRPVQVQFSLEMAPVDPSRKPKRVEIPHPLFRVASTTDDDQGLEEPDVCLIVKEESKPAVQEIIQQFPEYMGCVKKVLGLDSLRKKHAQYSQRRELLHKYDVFMADDRILPMLTSALGKDFIKAKKLPIPVAVTRIDALPLAVQKNLSAAFLTLSGGTSIMVRAGNSGMPVKKLTDNIIAIADNAVLQIPRKWANIRGIAIKTPESLSLPFYNKTPEELLEIAKTAGVEPAFKHKEEQAETSPGKRKLEIAAKSPLVQALKKQKKDEKESEKANKKASKAEEAPVSTEKSGKKRKDSNAEEQDTRKSAEKSGKAKRKKQYADGADDEASPTKVSKQKQSTENFIAAKKFKGSKKGYAFMKGKQGLGYYVDKKPVPDKMLLEALSRRANESEARSGGGSRRKSGGNKRRGRR